MNLKKTNQPAAHLNKMFGYNDLGPSLTYPKSS